MMYGPIKHAPNPVQRAVQSSPIVGVTLLGQFCALMSDYGWIVAGLGLFVIGLTHLILLVVTTVLYFLLPLGRGLSREEIDNTIVPYLRWPRWLPGYVDPSQALESALRASDDDATEPED